VRKYRSLLEGRKVFEREKEKKGGNLKDRESTMHERRE